MDALVFLPLLQLSRELCKNSSQPSKNWPGTSTVVGERVADRSLYSLPSWRKADTLRHELKCVPSGKWAKTHRGGTGYFLPPQSKFSWSSRKWSGIHTINYASCLPNELSCRDNHVRDQKNVISPGNPAVTSTLANSRSEFMRLQSSGQEGAIPLLTYNAMLFIGIIMLLYPSGAQIRESKQWILIHSACEQISSQNRSRQELLYCVELPWRL